MTDTETPALSFQPYPHLVLVRGPETRHIAVFALAHEQSRPPFERVVSTGYKATEAVVGADTAHKLHAGRYGAFQVIVTRMRVALQTAEYSAWLAFEASEEAASFELNLQTSASTNLVCD